MVHVDHSSVRADVYVLDEPGVGQCQHTVLVRQVQRIVLHHLWPRHLGNVHLHARSSCQDEAQGHHESTYLECFQFKLFFRHTLF